MNLTDSKYKDFALVKEMLETCDVIRNFKFGQAADAAAAIREAGRLFLTGEGSSRIFPAKNMIRCALQKGVPVALATEGGRQASEYDLSSYAVFGASNSGQTKEVIALFTALAEAGHNRRYGLTAHENTRLDSVSNECFVLSCGDENAVAATKSVVEQAMFYRSLICQVAPECFHGDGRPMLDNQAAAADAAEKVLTTELDPQIVSAIAAAPVIYFAGRNDGVAEELTLKTNEITRKKSDYLEGTYAVHGVEEVMNADEVVLLVDPFPNEVEKIKETLVDGVGLKVIAISATETIFPTIQIPQVDGYETILQLLAGWNVLVSVGVANGIDLDKPERARKIGNEFVE
ncbi:MAG: sugar isomerase [Planctomycetia bacterium]|jgi:glucosamine--fructose-6-phosphate aminotransferase (isomerizing)